MPDLTSRLTVKLIDSVSAPARGAAAALRRLNAAATSGGRGGGLVAVQERLAAAGRRNAAALAAVQSRMLGVAAAGYGIHRAVTPAVTTAAEFETVIEDIKQKADVGAPALAQLAKNIRAIGKATAQGPLATGRAADFLLGMGFSGDAAKDVATVTAMLPAIGKAASAYRADMTDLAKSSHAVVQSLRVAPEELGAAIDAMAKAGKSGGFELADMAKNFAAITAAAQFAGARGVRAVADISAALQVARKGAGDGAQAANNLQNFFQKLTLKETIANFKKFRVDILKELKFARDRGISPIEHMINVLNKVTGGDNDKIAQLFGDRQVLDFLKPMLADMAEYRRIRAEALAATGEAERDFASRMATSAARWAKFSASVQDLKISIGNALLPALTALVDKFGALADRLNAFAEANPRVVAGLAKIAGGLFALKAGALALRFLGLTAKGGLIALAAGALKIGGSMASAAGGAVALQRALGAMSGQRLTLFQTLATGIGGMVRAVPGIGLVAGALGTVVGALSGPLLGAIAGVAAGGLLLWKYWSRISAVVGGAAARLGEELAPALDMVRPVLDALAPVAKAVGDAFGWIAEKASTVGSFFGGLFQKENLSDADKAALEASGRAAMDSLLSGLKSGAAAIFGYVSGLASRIVSSIASAASGAGRALRGAASAIVGGGTPAPARARGGPVTRGRTYMVGERRAELFTPSQSGYVSPRVPDGGSSAPVTVNASITVNGAGDAEGVARKVVAVIKREMREGLRAVQGDVGAGFAY
jgi:TP901 family phage tail tape measure protein